MCLNVTCGGTNCKLYPLPSSHHIPSLRYPIPTFGRLVVECIDGATFVAATKSCSYQKPLEPVPEPPVLKYRQVTKQYLMRPQEPAPVTADSELLEECTPRARAAPPLAAADLKEGGTGEASQMPKDTNEPEPFKMDDASWGQTWTCPMKCPIMVDIPLMSLICGPKSPMAIMKMLHSIIAIQHTKAAVGLNPKYEPEWSDCTNDCATIFAKVTECAKGEDPKYRCDVTSGSICSTIKDKKAMIYVSPGSRNKPVTEGKGKFTSLPYGDRIAAKFRMCLDDYTTTKIVAAVGANPITMEERSGCLGKAVPRLWAKNQVDGIPYTFTAMAGSTRGNGVGDAIDNKDASKGFGEILFESSAVAKRSVAAANLKLFEDAIESVARTDQDMASWYRETPCLPLIDVNKKGLERFRSQYTENGECMPNREYFSECVCVCVFCVCGWVGYVLLCR